MLSRGERRRGFAGAADSEDTPVIVNGSPANVAVSAAVCSVADQVQRCLRTIRREIMSLTRLPFERLSGEEVIEVVRELEATARSAFGVQVRAAAEVEERALADVYGSRSAAHLLHEVLNITIGEARARLEASRVGVGQETITGEAIAPSMSALIDAIDAGAISGDHARVITRCLARIPLSVDEDTVETCRHTLLDQARQRDINGLQKVADQILAIVIEDGALPTRPKIAPNCISVPGVVMGSPR